MSSSYLARTSRLSLISSRALSHSNRAVSLVRRQRSMSLSTSISIHLSYALLSNYQAPMSSQLNSGPFWQRVGSIFTLTAFLSREVGANVMFDLFQAKRRQERGQRRGQNWGSYKLLLSGKRVTF